MRVVNAAVIIITLAPVGERGIVMSVSVVCLCVCLSVREHISGTGPNYASDLRHIFVLVTYVFSALTLLVGWQEGRWGGGVGAGVAICLERSADLHMSQLMPLPLTVSCFSIILIGFTILVPAHPGSPGQRAV